MSHTPMSHAVSRFGGKLFLDRLKKSPLEILERDYSVWYFLRAVGGQGRLREIDTVMRRSAIFLWFDDSG
mgnify:FL=1